MSKIEEIERLNALKNEIKQVNQKILKYATYPSKEMANTLAKLLTSFQGFTYESRQGLGINKFFVQSTSKGQYEFFLEHNVKDLKPSERKEILVDHTILCPRGYRSITDYYEIEHLPSCVSHFIEYAFNRRVEKDLVDITQQDLDEILNDFIQGVKEQQQQKENNLKEEQLKKEREAFERKCLVDRESIFDAIASVITNSDEKATSRTHYDKQLDKDSKENTFIFSHSVYILVKGHLRDFKVLLDKVVAPQEKEKEIQIDSTKQSYINFFDLKNHFSYAYENVDCFHQFMDGVESLYKEKKILEKEDIESVLDSRKQHTNKVMQKGKNV